MSNDELFKVMQDVPIEAGVEDLAYCQAKPDVWEWRLCGRPITVYIAQLLWEASMTRWLAERIPGDSLGLIIKESHTEKPSFLTHALAAACVRCAAGGPMELIR